MSDINVVDAPAFPRDAAVASHPPAQDKLENASTRKIHHGSVDKSSRVTGPCLPTSQRIATAIVDGAVVTAANKAATRSKDILKTQPAIIADLQGPAIEPLLKVEIVAESHLHWPAIAHQHYAWRQELLVADHVWIVYERCIGRCISWWRGNSRIRCHPRRA